MIDGLTVSACATIVGNEITANGDPDTAVNVLQMQGIADDWVNAYRVRIANAPINTAINGTTWSVQPISARQFDLIGSIFIRGCTSLSGIVCVGASGTSLM